MKNAKHTLNDIQFYEEDGAWYARMKYILEDDHEIREVIFPKADIGIDRDCPPEVSCVRGFGGCCEDAILTLHGRNFQLYKGRGHEGSNNVFCTEKLLKKKTRKMTVAEIEKKLGYKIEIISEE